MIFLINEHALMDHSSKKLSKEEREDKNDEGVPMPAKTKADPEQDDQWNWQMYGEVPLKAKTSDISPPIAKRDVEQENQQCRCE
jgi:hypothetical protein